MADFNQKQPGEALTNQSAKFREQMIVKNTYQVGDETGYSPNHPNALSDGDGKGRGNSIYLGVYGEDIGTKTDIMGNGEVNTGRLNNLKTNLYGKDNPYNSGNVDSGNGYAPQK